MSNSSAFQNNDLVLKKITGKPGHIDTTNDSGDKYLVKFDDKTSAWLAATALTLLKRAEPSQ